jgi:hypothetical protein
MKYQVVVGNIGTVYDGNSYLLAIRTYGEYVDQSKTNYGRAAGEPVALFEDGEIIKELEKHEPEPPD